MSDLIKRLCRPGYDLQKEQAIQEAIIEIRELRTKIEAMEKQEPVAFVDYKLGSCFRWAEYLGWQKIKDGTRLYALPGAQQDLNLSDPAVQKRLAAQWGYVPAGEQGGWLRAVDEALVVAHIGVVNADDTYEQAKDKLNNLIGFHTDVATDPAVNGGYKLVPIELTDEMVRIATAEYVQSCSRGLHPNIAWRRAFEAMISVAPKAKGEEK